MRRPIARTRLRTGATLPITVVQASTAGSGSGTSTPTSFASPVTTGNGIVVVVNYAANTLTSITHSEGNSYSLAAVGNFFGVMLSSIYYTANPTGGSSFSVTANFGSGTSCEIQAFEIAGQL